MCVCVCVCVCGEGICTTVPHRPDGFGFELESAVLALHDHCKGKEDEGRRLWKKAWGFNLFPMFISPPGDKPCAI